MILKFQGKSVLCVSTLVNGEQIKIIVHTTCSLWNWVDYFNPILSTGKMSQSWEERAEQLQTCLHDAKLTEIAIKPQDRVMFKLLLSWKLWGDSKQKACCFQEVFVCAFPNEAVLRNGALHSPPSNGSLNPAPVVIKAVLREEQDVALIHNFDCVFLNISKQMLFRVKRSGNKPCWQCFPSRADSCSWLSVAQNVAALFGNSGQVFLAPGSPVFPTKHLGYLRSWVCQVHTMFLPPVEVYCSVWGENFTCLKDSCWVPRQAFMEAINISYEVWELGGFFWGYQGPQK